MNYTEECVRIPCGGESLVGIVARPEHPARVGLVIIVGGPQYRAGSHRQFTLLSRAAAAEGFAVLRFDYRGMGDSTGSARDFQTVTDDIGAATLALRQAVPSVERVALWGLCDGASAALMYVDEARGDDPRAAIAGLCLLNPWVRSAQTQAAAQVKHYYVQRLRHKAFWSKLLRGQVTADAVRELLANTRRMLFDPRTDQAVGATAGHPRPFQARMASSWARTPLPLLLVLSGQDLTAKEFIEALTSDPCWRGALARPLLTRVDLPEADHTFSNQAARNAVERATVRWLQQLELGVDADPKRDTP